MVAGVKAIHGSTQAMLLIGLAVRVRVSRSARRVVLFGPIAEGSLGIGVDATGLLFAVPGIGGILVTALAGKARRALHTAGILTASVFLGGHPAHDALVHPRARPRRSCLLMVEGAAVIIADVVTTTTLQRVVPNDRVGSVFGILGAATVIGMVIGSLVAPSMIELFDLSIATAFAGGVLLVRHAR